MSRRTSRILNWIFFSCVATPKLSFSMYSLVLILISLKKYKTADNRMSVLVYGVYSYSGGIPK